MSSDVLSLWLANILFQLQRLRIRIPPALLVQIDRIVSPRSTSLADIKLFSKCKNKFNHTLQSGCTTLQAAFYLPNFYSPKVCCHLGGRYGGAVKIFYAATIAQWICLRLPSPGSNPRHNIYTFFDSYFKCDVKSIKISNLCPGLAHLLLLTFLPNNISVCHLEKNSDAWIIK